MEDDDYFQAMDHMMRILALEEEQGDAKETDCSVGAVGHSGDAGDVSE